MLLQVNSVIREKHVEAVEIEPHGGCCVRVSVRGLQVVVTGVDDLRVTVCVGGGGDGSGVRYAVAGTGGRRGVLSPFL